MDNELFNKESIYNYLKEILLFGYDIEERDFSLDSSLTNCLALDSLDLVEIQLNLEKKFKISFNDDDLEKWDKVKDVVDSIKEKIN